MVHSQVSPASELLIGEFARRVGASKDTIRFYTRLGMLSSSNRRAGTRTYAIYSQSQIERYEFIEFCKGLGFTLKDIGQALKEMDAGTFSDRRRQTLVENKLLEIETTIAELRAAHAKLRATLGGKKC
jgi:MerR family Zn(II)-responsive transcriptional regulator of zntA